MMRVSSKAAPSRHHAQEWRRTAWSLQFDEPATLLHGGVHVRHLRDCQPDMKISLHLSQMICVSANRGMRGLINPCTAYCLLCSLQTQHTGPASYAQTHWGAQHCQRAAGARLSQHSLQTLSLPACHCLVPGLTVAWRIVKLRPPSQGHHTGVMFHIPEYVPQNTVMWAQYRAARTTPVQAARRGWAQIKHTSLAPSGGS